MAPQGRTPNQVASYPNGFINGLTPQWGSTTTLTVTSGSCRDSSNTANIDLAATVTINAATVGANGIDTGSLANSTVYGIYLIGDSMNKSTCPPAAIVSATLTAPALPAGYDMYRQIGFWATDGSAHFLLGYYFGSGNYRKFDYDSVVSVLSAGTSTTFAAVDLSSVVPSLSATANVPVQFVAQFTPNVAADKASFRQTGGTGTTPRDVTGVVTTKAQDTLFSMQSGFASAKAEIDYKVATSGSLNLLVAGFEVSV